MKRFLFTGLCLLVLTLISCSRKKAEAAAPAVSGEEGIEVHALQIEKITPDFSQANKLNPDTLEPDEESLLEEESRLEEERLGTDVLNYLEDEANFSSPIIEDTNPVSAGDQENPPQVESVEKRLLDSYNRLKVMEYEDELFFPVKKDDSSILIHYSNKTAIRLFYDQRYRLSQKEYWKMDSVDNAKKTADEKYSYKDEATKPYEKIIETENAIFVSKLDENGLVIRSEKYEADDSKSIEGKKPESVTEWTYDEKKRITSESVTEAKLVKKQLFDYSKTDGKIQVSKVHGRQEQQEDIKEEQSGQELPPDYEYYENGILLTKTEYLSKGNYSTTIYFDSVNSVRSDYENYIKVRDVYYTNGVERRVRNYE